MTNYYVVKKHIWYRPDQRYYDNGTVTLDHLSPEQIALLISRGTVVPYVMPRVKVASKVMVRPKHTSKPISVTETEEKTK